MAEFTLRLIIQIGLIVQVALAASIPSSSQPNYQEISSNYYGSSTESSSSSSSNQGDQQPKTATRQQPEKQHQLAAEPTNQFEIIANESTAAVPNFYSNQPQQQANSNSKFRVNVSNVCEKSQMRVTVRLNRPFYGLIHAKERRKKAACSVEGNGEQTYTLDISFTLVQSEPAYCGMVGHYLGASWMRQQIGGANSLLNGLPLTRSTPTTPMNQSSQQQTLSLALVVRLHKTIEFSDDRYFLLSCPNRCPRADCSTNPSIGFDANKATAALNSAQATRGFVASDSILSPIFRSGNTFGGGGGGGIADLQPSAKLTSSSSSASSSLFSQGQPQQATTITERCDLMIDLKFQWLVKLCWILMALLAVMLCTIFYLCVSSDGRKRRQEKRRRRRQASARRSERKNQQGAAGALVASSSSAGSSVAQSFYQPATSTESVAAWSSPSVPLKATTATTAAAAAANADNLEQVREDNSYLAAKQHQQLLLNDLMVKNAALEYDHQQQQKQRQSRADNNNNNVTNNTNHGPIMGRSADTFAARRAQHQQQHYGAQIQRRRSIGSAVVVPSNALAAAVAATAAESTPKYSFDQAGKLDSNQRVKSKSQTIYYEQGQDPFKAIPFSYLGTGSHHHLDRNATSQKHHLDSNATAAAAFDTSGDYQMRYSLQANDDRDHNHNFAQDHTKFCDYGPQSLPMGVYPPSKFQFDFGRENKPESFFDGSQNWQSQLHSQAAELSSLNHQQNQRLSGSQFDPQNSRHLINLIQHKHREQIAQANRTAASMNSKSGPKVMPRPILNQQRQMNSSNEPNARDEQWR